jgi:hypothetical protein
LRPPAENDVITPYGFGRIFRADRLGVSVDAIP